MADIDSVRGSNRRRGSKPQVLRHLPAHVYQGVRGDRSRLNEDLWTLLSSNRTEAELDRATIVARGLRPFVDEEVFGPDPDLGPFEPLRDWRDREAVGHTTRPSMVEPRFGWVISLPHHLVHRGHINSRGAKPRPSFRAMRRARRTPGATIEVPAVITLRDAPEQNYGHFLTDLVGGRLRLAAEFGLDDVPILVSEKLAHRRFFQDFVRRSGLDDQRLVIQDDRFVLSERIYFFETSHFSPKAIEFLHRCLSVPDSDPQSRRRIFVAREAHRRGRAFINMSAVADVCRKFGFEIVYTDNLGLEEQMELFSEAGFVVAASGAALDNIVFRKNAAMSVLEISPPGMVPPEPWWFYKAKVLGHRYDCMYGGAPDGVVGKAAYRRDFQVDIDGLSERISAMLELG